MELRLFLCRLNLNWKADSLLRISNLFQELKKGQHQNLVTEDIYLLQSKGDFVSQVQETIRLEGYESL